MVLNEKYHTACDFAFKLSRSFFTDITHDAFVAWFDKTNKNLFDEEEEVVLRAVKKMFYKKYHGKRTVAYREKMTQVFVTPENQLIEKEMGLVFLTFEEVERGIDDMKRLTRAQIGNKKVIVRIESGKEVRPADFLPA